MFISDNAANFDMHFAEFLVDFFLWNQAKDSRNGKTTALIYLICFLKFSAQLRIYKSWYWIEKVIAILTVQIKKNCFKLSYYFHKLFTIMVS